MNSHALMILSSVRSLIDTTQFARTGEQPWQKSVKIESMLVAAVALVLFQAPNTLSSAEKRDGWKLLFDGKTTANWHNFKSKSINPGWQVVDGALTIVNPDQAGDIVTQGKYDWFELSIDFKMEPGQNSGIMFHVADEGEATWHSGPEIQIYDNKQEEGVETTGFLYQLYKPSVDAAKPAGEWNTMRILISPEKCSTVLNGVLYYEFVLNSEDFNARVAKSKFALHKEFSTIKKGTIAIQGDHGKVAFRNIKIRELKAKVSPLDFESAPEFRTN